MTSQHALHSQSQVAVQAIEEVKRNVRKFIAKTHPAALVAWFFVGAILLACVLFTGWHNWNLFARGSNTDFGEALAVIPPLLLDGSILLLLVLLLTYFRDSLQWWVAVVFNALLFIIVGINTSLDYSLNTGEALGDGMKYYLRWGVLCSFLTAFAIWEILIHLDPYHRRQKERAKLEDEASTEAHEAELKLLKLQLQQQRDEITYQEAIAKKIHSARMKATASDKVDAALLEFEEQEALQRAKEIRGYHPKA